MRRFVLGLLTAVLLTAQTAGVALAQRGQPPPPPAADSPGAEAQGPPAFQYFVAVGCTVLVLFTVCKPSRKFQ